MRYWPYYCEENIWQLCGEPRFAEAQVVFISNPRRQVALWAQRAAEDPLEPVIWDYHVVLLATSDAGSEVWDLDSALGFPVPARHYLDLTFAGTYYLPTSFAPRFRLLPAADYRRHLASDRSHMRRADGTFLHPPPPWDPPGEGGNLMRFVEMESRFLGQVCDLSGLQLRLQC